MNRRAMLSCIGGIAALTTAGCLSAVPLGGQSTPTPSADERCADREFPNRHLGIIKLDTAEGPPDSAAVIQYAELPPGEQAIIQRAIEGDRYAICLPEARSDRVDRFTSLVERITDETQSVPEGPYLVYEDTYYRFTAVRTGDQVFVTAHA